MKPENEIGLVETPITDCSAVNDAYNLALLQASEMAEIVYYSFLICRYDGMEDVTDLESVGESRVGSSPTTCTKTIKTYK